MPTAFGNYTPEEVERRLAKRDYVLEQFARRVVMHVVITGDTNVTLLQMAVLDALGPGAWDRLVKEAVQQARLDGSGVRGPYAKL